MSSEINFDDDIADPDTVIGFLYDMCQKKPFESEPLPDWVEKYISELNDNVLSESINEHSVKIDIDSKFIANNKKVSKVILSVIVPNIRKGINGKDFHLKCGKFEFAWSGAIGYTTQDTELRYYVRENYHELIEFTSLPKAINDFLTYTSNPNLYSKWFGFMEKVGGLKTLPSAYP